MGESTGISWTDHTFNPWWGCQRVSPGCEHCYAEKLAVTRRKLDVWGPPKTTERKRIASGMKDLPKWNAAAKRDGVRRRVFCASMADVFEDAPQVALWRAEALDLLAQCEGLDVQLLTKRPQNIRAMVPPSWLESWPAHVWVGTTVEDQRRANERIPHLLAVPAAVRFLSCEPLLEAVDLAEWIAPMSMCSGCGKEHEGHIPGNCPSCNTDSLITTWGEAQAERWRTGDRYDPECPEGIADVNGDGGIGWVIVGGESGPGARPFDLAWARSIVAQCDAAGVPVFVKQAGDAPFDSDIPVTVDVTTMRAKSGNVVRFRAHHGADPAEWPEGLRRQNFPAMEGGR